MTQKLYLDDSYRRECHSSVVERTDVNGKPGVILDRTIFYPTSGGQPHDTGTINESSVIDVFEDQRHRIVHLIKTPFSGVRIEGRLNWTRRFDHMQQLMQIACMSINGHGGGHPQRAQGGGPLEEALQRAVDAI